LGLYIREHGLLQLLPLLIRILLLPPSIPLQDKLKKKKPIISITEGTEEGLKITITLSALSLLLIYAAPL
jgi:hypothetical protein